MSDDQVTPPRRTSTRIRDSAEKAKKKADEKCAVTIRKLSVFIKKSTRMSAIKTPDTPG